MSCQSNNCFTEDEIQDVFETLSRLTGMCFPSISTSYIPANTTVTEGFLITNTGTFIGTYDLISRFEVVTQSTTGTSGAKPFKPC